MENIEFEIISEDVNTPELLLDYWKFGDKRTFALTIKDVIEKYGIQTPSILAKEVITYPAGNVNTSGKNLPSSSAAFCPILIRLSLVFLRDRMELSRVLSDSKLPLFCSRSS